MMDVAQAVSRAEDARLLRITAATAGLPYRLRVTRESYMGALDVRIGHVLVASVQPDSLTIAWPYSPDDVARWLGHVVRAGWFAFDPLPIPDNITLGDS